MDILGASFYRSSQFGDGNLQQLIGNVQCSGSETSLLNCSYQYNPSSFCYYGRTAGVRCYSKIMLIYCTNGNDDFIIFQTLHTVLKEISD